MLYFSIQRVCRLLMCLIAYAELMLSEELDSDDEWDFAGLDS